MPLTSFDIGYAAGIIDGEGCISIYRRYRVVRVDVGQAEKGWALIDWLEAKFKAKVVGPYSYYKDKSPVKRAMWSSTVALQFLSLIKDHLVIKKDAAELVIAYSKLIAGRSKFSRWTYNDLKIFEMYSAELTKLNQKGLNAPTEGYGCEKQTKILDEGPYELVPPSDFR